MKNEVSLRKPIDSVTGYRPTTSFLHYEKETA